jgi:hypothetical protein
MVLTSVIATNADKVFSDFSNDPFEFASQIQNARLPCFTTSKASVYSLSPVILSVQGYLTSELLRFL